MATQCSVKPAPSITYAISEAPSEAAFGSSSVSWKGKFGEGPEGHRRANPRTQASTRKPTSRLLRSPRSLLSRTPPRCTRRRTRVPLRESAPDVSVVSTRSTIGALTRKSTRALRSLLSYLSDSFIKTVHPIYTSKGRIWGASSPTCFLKNWEETAGKA